MNNANSPQDKISQKTFESAQEIEQSIIHTKPSHVLEFSKDRVTIVGFGSAGLKPILKCFPDETWQELKNAITSLARSGSLSGYSLVSRIRAISRFLRIVPTSCITTQDIAKYYHYCETHGGRFIELKLILLYWHSSGYKGIENEVAILLTTLNNPRKARPAGSRIRSDNNNEGWYTDQEYDDLVSIIWSDYEIGKNGLLETTACLLTAQYGRRPVQLAQLKNGDFKEDGETLGVKGKRVEFPGAKDHSTSQFRKSKIEVHPMDDILWRLCKMQTDSSAAAFECYLGRKLTAKEICELPFFPPQKIKTILVQIERAKKHTTFSENFLSSQYLHLTSARLSNITRRWQKGTPVLSARTGKTLVESAYRLRYTRAKQLAKMGIPRTTLQYWLGHEDPRTLEVYYDDPAERARELNEVIQPLMAPLAQAFLGTIRDTEKEAIRGSDPSSRIELDGREDGGVGTCGEYGFCSASVPIPCYRCTKFQPWVYGPHEEVLNRLLERQRLENEVPLPGMGKRLLIPLQLDKDINAVKIVISLCNMRKSELGGKYE